MQVVCESSAWANTLDVYLLSRHHFSWDSVVCVVIVSVENSDAGIVLIENDVEGTIVTAFCWCCMCAKEQGFGRGGCSGDDKCGGVDVEAHCEGF